MKIANFETADGLRQGIGIVTDDGLLDFGRALAAYQSVIGEVQDDYYSIYEMIEDGTFEPEIFQIVMDFIEHTGLEIDLTVDDYRLLAPIPKPPSIYALGLNYPAHAIEHSGNLPDEPVVFLKASSAVVGPEDPVIFKKSLSRVDPEVELAIIIGQKCSNVSEADAMDYVAGYTIVNDVTARDMQAKDIASAQPWFRSKSIDTFCPMGPWVIFPDQLDVSKLELEMRVNGEIRQKDNTESMIFKIPYLISWLSQYFTLYPGDVISTGTPEGMKPVAVGDIMEAYVEGIGILRNPVVAEP